MRSGIAALALVACASFAPTASAHGDLAVNEFETLAIRDFEGQEDSFAWEGFEIWDVYVGDGYSQAYDADGAYFKVNFAGDGTQRPTGSAAWTINFQFKIGEEAFERELSHDGATVTSDFENLEWTIADGNVLQVKAWVPVPEWGGQAVKDIVIVSSVDGDPRDTAPGGIHLPATGTEVPVEGPGTPVFPPLGEGRIVDEVKLTGPAKYLNVSIAPQGAGIFDITVQNPLKEQGQHVFLRGLPDGAAWTLNASASATNLAGGASTMFHVTLAPTATNGIVEPLTVELYTDIGGRQTYYAYLDEGEVMLVSDAAAARAATIEAPKEAPGLGLLAVLASVGVALYVSRAGVRRP